MMNDSQTQDSTVAVAVIGMAGRFPGARNLEEFWRNLRAGVESVTFFSDEELAAAGVGAGLLGRPEYVKARGILESADLFDASFFGFNPVEASVLDPQQRLFMECAWEALENAGYEAERYEGAVGVFAGASMSTYLLNLFGNESVPVGPYIISISNDKDHLPLRTSYKLNLKGPSVAVQTSCSTSLVAVHLACQSLLSYQCDIALGGGVSVTVPQKSGYLYVEGGINSPDGHCKPFDARANGTVSGSGVGVVVLKRLSDAFADGDSILAVIRGSAINNDGSLKVGYTAPSVDGQAAVIAMAQAAAEVEPETITYVEAHGTGTFLGDPIEIAALTQAFRDGGAREKQFCAVGSVKSNIGHTDAAAGVTGLIKTVLALRHGEIPPSLHFAEPNPQIDFANSPFYVNAELSAWETGGSPRRAGVSSFGIGGTNAHVVVEEAPAPEAAAPSRPAQLLLVSARTDAALEAATANLAAHLRRPGGESLADVAYTLQVGRRAFERRRVLVSSDRADAAGALETLDARRVFTSARVVADRPVAFMFPGQGSQYVGMGRGLYETEAAFREQVDECAQLLRPHLGLDLRAVLYPEAGGEAEAARELARTALTQPALFVVEYALARLWASWGVVPRAMIGHSIGEYVAACLAGVFSLADALRLVATRGRLMQQLPEGAMLAVPLSEREVQLLLDKRLSLAAVNAPALCTVAGPPEQIDALLGELAARGVECQRLHTSHAFHSAMTEPMLEPFAEHLRRVGLKPPRIPFVSNLTGNWITDDEATDPGYWAKHLRHAVRFADGVRRLLGDAELLLLEVGPGRTLTSLANQSSDEPGRPAALSSLRHPRDRAPDVEFLLGALGKLWLAGVRVDWPAFSAAEERRRVPLPTYPFERKRHWIEAPTARAREAVPEVSASADANGDGRTNGNGRQPATDARPPRPPAAPPASVARALERTAERQLRMMSEQVRQQGELLSSQLELLRRAR
jgi:acyl transferase domain-containing protein